VIGLLAGAPERLSRRELAALSMLATFMIASQQSSLPLACVLLVALGGFGRWARREAAPPPDARLTRGRTL